MTGILLVIFAAVCYGAMPIFVRLVYAAGVEPFTLLCLRFDLASLLMLALLRLRRQPFPRGRTLVSLLLLGGVMYVSQSTVYYLSLTLLPAGLLALLFFLYPAVVTGLSVAFFKERITRVKLAALLLALCGGALTAGPRGGGGQPLGVALALSAAVLYGIYIILSGRVIAGVAPIPATTVIVLGAGVVFTAIALRRGMTLPTTWGGWAGILALVLVSTVLAIIAFMAGLERIGAANTAMISTVEPVTSIVLAGLVLGESIRPLQLLGGALILGAVMLLAHSELRSGKVEAVSERA